MIGRGTSSLRGPLAKKRGGGTHREALHDDREAHDDVCDRNQLIAERARR
jgi:hypothetical protein